MNSRNRSGLKRVFLLIILGISFVSIKGIHADAEVINIDDVRADVLANVDYDNVVAVGDYNCLMLEKKISGFDVNKVQYGLFDTETGEWLMEYTELPESDVPSVNISSNDDNEEQFLDFTYHENRVFSYQYYDSMKGTSYICFVSADAGGHFLLRPQTVQEEIKFENGRALVVLSDYKIGYVDGYIPPHNKLCWISTMGEVTDFEIPNFDNESPEKFAYFDSKNYGYQNCYAYLFQDIDHNQYMIIYYADEDKIFYILEQSYMTRVNVQSEVCVCPADNSTFFIYVGNLLGEDGNYYFSLFDQNGELATPATLIPDELRGTYPEWDFTGKTDYNSELLGTWTDDLANINITFFDNGTYRVEQEVEQEGYATEDVYLLDKENQILYVSPGGDGASPSPYVIFNNYLFYKGSILRKI